MKYTVKKLSEENKVELDVVFGQDEYNKVYEVELAKEMAKAEIKGFRKGKAPRSMYLKMYGDSKVHNEVANQLISQSYNEILQKEKLNVVAMPNVDLLTECADDEWGYKAVVAVYPEIDVKDYFGIVAKKEEVVIDEEKVQEEIDKVLARHADLEVVEDGTVENGLTVVFDFCGSVDGKEFEGGKAENYELEIGSGKFIPGFEEQMIGMKLDEEKVLKVKFPEQYAKELAGKDAEFKVKVHEIKKRVLPVLNDEFVKELDDEKVNTVEEWKAALKEKLTNDALAGAEAKFEDDVFAKLLENNPVEIPEEMITDGVNRKVSQLEESAKQYQMPADLLLKYQGIESMDKYKELITPGVKNNIHYEIVINAITEKEKIELNDADYEKYYNTLAAGQDLEDVKKKYAKEMVTEYFKMLKAHDLVLESVKEQ